MKTTLYTNDIAHYLQCSDIIDFDNVLVAKLADKLYSESNGETDFVRKSFEYVRDRISHSADIGADEVTCTASQVLKAGHGICFAKSHLLAAILRSKRIPTGFCYQKLVLDDDADVPELIYHGLNGVFLKEYDKWIRLDARGNKEGVNAQFGIDTEQLAFPIRSDKGEQDGYIVYPEPDREIVKALTSGKTRTELWNELPMKLEYNMVCGIRKWRASDAGDLAAALSNRKVLDNLRDGLPYPYTENDAAEFIETMLSADDEVETKHWKLPEVTASNFRGYNHESKASRFQANAWAKQLKDLSIRKIECIFWLISVRYNRLQEGGDYARLAQMAEAITDVDNIFPYGGTNAGVMNVYNVKEKNE